MEKIKEGIHVDEFETEGRRVRFLLDYKPGARDLVVAVHGLTCERGSFKHMPGHPLFSRSCLLIPDLLGFGESDKPEDFSYAMEDQARMLETLINEFFPGMPVHIVAHSMGGAVCLFFSPGFYQRTLTFADLEGNLIAEDCGLLSRGIIQGSLEHYRSRGFERQKRKLRDSKLLRLDLTTPFAVYRSAQSLVDRSDSGKLAELFLDLPMKKAYFYGEKNSGMNVLERLPGVEPVEISDAGHEMMEDNPREFYEKLAAFMYTP